MYFARNLIAVLVGLFIGGAINMFIISISSKFIPPPNGVNVDEVESIARNIHLYIPKHFIFPFLAHALGTFFGSFIASLIAFKYKLWVALSIGVFFLIGGIMMVLMVPSPIWFTVLDLFLAYVPMSLLAYYILTKSRFNTI